MENDVFERIQSGLIDKRRTLVPENDSPVDVLKRVNRLFLHNANFSTFMNDFIDGQALEDDITLLACKIEA